MRAFLLFSLLLLNACATVTADSDQRIEVVTTPAGARCGLSNDKGIWQIDSTPGSVKVKRAFKPLEITCKSAEGAASTSLEATTRGRAYGNILMGGVPAVVDAYTGEGYEYVPAKVTLTLQ